MPNEIVGESQTADGVSGTCHTEHHAGVVGINDAGGTGVIGLCSKGNGAGVAGQNTSGGNGPGVAGLSASGPGVAGVSSGLDGVVGTTHSERHGGVSGINDAGGAGVIGLCSKGNGAGVAGQNTSGGNGPGVAGLSASGPGVAGVSSGLDGVVGTTHSERHGGVSGINDAGGAGVIGLASKGAGPGVLGQSTADGPGVLGIGRIAGSFRGDVEVTGDVRLLNADCAEEFDILGTEEAEPGTVMILGQEGGLEASQQAYDKRVAGVISGAGDFKPGVILDTKQSRGNRVPIALLGKVYCKVDAQYAPIEVGDLLVSSPTPGHAMKAADPLKAFGSVIGKALRPLQAGQRLVPILIALQ